MRAPRMKRGPAVDMMRTGETSGCGKLLYVTSGRGEPDSLLLSLSLSLCLAFLGSCVKCRYSLSLSLSLLHLSYYLFRVSSWIRRTSDDVWIVSDDCNCACKAAHRRYDEGERGAKRKTQIRISLLAALYMGALMRV